MTEEQESLLRDSVSNQKIIIGRLKSLEKQLNQIIPKKRIFSDKTEKDLLSALGASEFLGVSETQFYDRVRGGQIPFVYVDGIQGKRFSKAALKEWITSRPERKTS